jgi:hypothetical protein
VFFIYYDLELSGFLNSKISNSKIPKFQILIFQDSKIVVAIILEFGILEFWNNSSAQRYNSIIKKLA